jgi:hypothetical protein
MARGQMAVAESRWAAAVVAQAGVSFMSMDRMAQ